MHPTQHSRSLGHPQGGAVLIVGMIMMLLMTIVALAAIRGSGMQEQMAGNMRNLNLAFQGAEAALREGEDAIRDNLNNFGPAVNGFYPSLSDPNSNPNFAAPVDWTNEEWQGNRALDANSIGRGPNNLLAGIPRYVVEEVPYTCETGSDLTGQFAAAASDDGIPDDFIHRVTSRGVGGTVNSVALLQSTFIFLPCTS